MDDGDVERGGARVDPVQAKLVSVTLMYGLDGVPQVVEQSGECLEIPAFAALCLPSLAIVFISTPGRDPSRYCGLHADERNSRKSDRACRGT